MPGFPPVFDKDPAMQAWMTMMEEAVTNLAGQHGKLEPRENIKNIGPNLYSATPPVTGTIYPDLIAKAWAETDSTGAIRGGVNLACTPIATGQYRYNFLTKPIGNDTSSPSRYAVFATLYSQDGSIRHIKYSDWTFDVLITIPNFGVGAMQAANDRHSVLVFAPAEPQ